MPTLHLTDDQAADELLSDNMLALLLGMLLDQLATGSSGHPTRSSTSR